MKKLGTLALLGLLLMVLSAAGQEAPKEKPLTKEKEERFREGVQLWTQAKQLKALGKFEEAVSATEKALTIARDVYGNFHPNVHSGREVNMIGRLLQAPEANVRTGLKALEADIKKASASGELARCRYIHFATHGILGSGDGKPPALVLSLVGNDDLRDEFGRNDGFLRLDEVTGLKLNADLVVLSACRSGQGQLRNGEGVSGLARAFLYAGSRGVVCSLWSVADAETADLMTDMYTRLQAGKLAADALREARLEMLKAGKPPIYWAPFILIGE